jgi:hypothetical protein
MQYNIKTIAVAGALLIMVLPIGYSLVSPVVSRSAEDSSPFLDLPEGQCVEETTYMRYHHMELLKETREKAVRQGDRGTVGINGREITLNNCMECHESRERFCSQCHQAVNLQLNCFRCHYDPELAEEAGI